MPKPQPQDEDEEDEDAEPMTIEESTMAGEGLPAAPRPAPRQAPAAVVQAGPGSNDGLILTAHVWHADKSRRMVSINNKMAREGEEVSPGVVIEQITRDAVIVNSNGQRIEKKAY
jgi:hypothetical protein